MARYFSLNQEYSIIDSKLEKFKLLVEENLNHFDFNLDKIWIDVKATKEKANHLEKKLNSYEDDSSSSSECGKRNDNVALSIVRRHRLLNMAF